MAGQNKDQRPGIQEEGVLDKPGEEVPSNVKYIEKQVRNKDLNILIGKLILGTSLQHLHVMSANYGDINLLAQNRGINVMVY